MIPEWSSSPIFSQFLPPRNEGQADPLLAKDFGPVALQDPSEGVRVKVWTARLEEGVLWIGADDVSETILFTRSVDVDPVNKIDLTFNQNGDPFIAFEQSGQIYIYWHDPLEGDNTFRHIAPGEDPFCHLDERRPEFSGISDIILVYKSGGVLYWAEQRDRFTVSREPPQPSSTEFRISGLGMQTNNRMGISVRVPEE